jgi:hypothetical protein
MLNLFSLAGTTRRTLMVMTGTSFEAALLVL